MNDIEKEIERGYVVFVIGGFFYYFFFLFTIFNTASSRPSETTVSEDAGIEPRTVATTVFSGCLP